jgi:transposase
MGRRHAISDADWERVKDLLPGQPGQHGGIAADNRRFLDAVLWIARTGAPWRDLPERLGDWNSQWRRFDRWAAKGRWEALAGVFRDPDLDVLVLDSTVVRAHPCAAGQKKKADGSGGQADEALGRSVGGFGTKIHGGMNGLGQPVELVLTAGQKSDIGQAEVLLADHEPEVVIADKGYDCDAFVEAVEGAGAEAVIPSRANRVEPRALDRHTYAERNVVERFWAQAKQFRRVATRYEKKAANFLAFVWVAALTVMLK